MYDRRAFLLATAGAVTALLPGVRELRAMPPASRAGGPFASHPDPRPGIDGSKVLSPSEVSPHVAELYEGVRRIPEVIDGIGCYCGCADVPGMYSLLSCYEESGMAQYCDICQGEARLALRLHEEGKDLAGIREDIDGRFGRGAR